MPPWPEKKEGRKAKLEPEIENTSKIQPPPISVSSGNRSRLQHAAFNKMLGKKQSRSQSIWQINNWKNVKTHCDCRAGERRGKEQTLFLLTAGQQRTPRSQRGALQTAANVRHESQGNPYSTDEEGSAVTASRAAALVAVRIT